MKAHLIIKAVFILASLLAMVVPAKAAFTLPTDTLGTNTLGTNTLGTNTLGINTLNTKRLQIHPSPGPGHPVQLTLPELPLAPVLVTIQDYLGTTRYQQWHAPSRQLTVRFQEPIQPLPPGMYLVVVSSSQLYLKGKFVFQY